MPFVSPATPQILLYPDMKTKPKKPTIAAISMATGISRQSISAWVKDGLDLGNKRAVAARVAQARARETGREDMQAAKLRKLKADADRSETTAARELGRLIPHAAVDGMFQSWGLVVRQAFDKLAVNLPPVIAGRSAGETHKLLTREFRDALTAIADSPPFRGIEEIINLKK